MPGLPPLALEHFQSPRNLGELPAPAITVRVENPACGDSMQLSVLVDKGRITRAGFKCRGCSASIASGSALTELITGMTVEVLRSFSADELERVLGGLPAESRHAAVLCRDAVRAVLTALK